MKVLSWIIVLCGVWEAGDIAALFVPGFGRVPAAVWNHIIVGIILVIAGAWASLTNNGKTARIMHWIAALAGIWLIVASSILRNLVFTVGLWNDIIVGGIVFILSIWAGLAAPRAVG